MHVLPVPYSRNSSTSIRIESLATRALRRRDQEAARHLGRLGVSGVRALVEALSRHAQVGSLMLHEALGQMEKDGTLPALRDLATPEAPFIGLLVDRRAAVRSATVRLLGYTRDHRWAAWLSRLLQDDPDPSVRCTAAEALGNLDAADTMPLLAEVADTPTDPARLHALRALAQFGAPAWSHLGRVAVLHPEDTVRRVAAETVARAGDAPTWQALVRSLGDAGSHEVRKTLVEGLGSSGVPRAAVPLVRVLVDDGSPLVRVAAAGALAMLRETRTLGALFDIARYDAYSIPAMTEHAEAGEGREPATGRRYPVREAAAEALRKLGGLQAWEELADAADDLTALPDGCPGDRREC